MLSWASTPTSEKILVFTTFLATFFYIFIFLYTIVSNHLFFLRKDDERKRLLELRAKKAAEAKNAKKGKERRTFRRGGFSERSLFFVPFLLAKHIKSKKTGVGKKVRKNMMKKTAEKMWCLDKTCIHPAGCEGSWRTQRGGNQDGGRLKNGEILVCSISISKCIKYYIIIYQMKWWPISIRW